MQRTPNVVVRLLAVASKAEVGVQECYTLQTQNTTIQGWAMIYKG